MKELQSIVEVLRQQLPIVTWKEEDQWIDAIVSSWHEDDGVIDQYVIRISKDEDTVNHTVNQSPKIVKMIASAFARRFISQELGDIRSFLKMIGGGESATFIINNHDVCIPTVAFKGLSDELIPICLKDALVEAMLNWRPDATA